MKHSNLSSVLNNLQGRFVSVLVKSGANRTSYSAKLKSHYSEVVTFVDTNESKGRVFRKVRRSSILGLKSGKNSFRRTKALQSKQANSQIGPKGASPWGLMVYKNRPPISCQLKKVYFTKKSVDLAPPMCIMVYMNAKERMNEWKKLPTNTIAWETFKRLVAQFGMDEGIKKAHKIIEKKG